MDIMEITPDGKSSQSMGSKEICILVEDDDDLTCYAIVAEMIRQYTNYEVLHIGDTLEVLRMMEKRKNSFELVLTNVDMLESRGSEIVIYINEQLNLPANSSNGDPHSKNRSGLPRSRIDESGILGVYD
ncbi:Uncharacterized protein Adt_44160 [Abeliophyllum distichum]|uniref:Response regulatory domain-containing protein n=1 Tax=Abeliophyllum distichum TaxID=126358 RepID=A0ABD1PA21_9LAMI